MIVISDTTPVRYLVEINKADILEILFKKIIVPHSVINELQHEKTPLVVKEWTNSLPHWVEVRHGNLSLYVPQKKIGYGEREAFALALELKANAVLMDDRPAGVEARRLNIPTIATFAVLTQAALQGLVDLREVLDQLRKTTFRLPPEEDILATLRQLDANRGNP
jgi:predicted nucleic acid-binding protein